MSIAAWLALGLALGLVLGWLAGSRRRALLASGVVGVLGATIGGFLAAVLVGLDISGVDSSSLVAAAIGAVLLIGLLQTLPADLYTEAS